MRTDSSPTSTPKPGGEETQVVVEQRAQGESLEAYAVRCAVTPAECVALRILTEFRPTIDVESVVALLRAAPLRADVAQLANRRQPDLALVHVLVHANLQEERASLHSMPMGRRCASCASTPSQPRSSG